MKVAFCFSGHLRYLENLQYWKKIIEKYDADVYGSFWNAEELEINTFVQEMKPVKIEFENFENFKKSTIDIFSSEILPPRNLTVESQRIAKECKYLPMWYKIWRCNNLTKDKDYDIVVRTRTDIFFDNFKNLELNDCLNIPVGSIGVWSWKNNEGPIDIFAYGKPDIMDYYSVLYLYLSRYLKDGHYFFPAENLLKVHLAQKDIMIKQFFSGVFLCRAPKFCFNHAYTGLSEQIYNSRDYNIETDVEYSFFTHFSELNFNFENFIKDYPDVVNAKYSNRYKFYEYIIPKLVSKNKPLYILETGTMHAGIENSQGAFTHVMSNLIKNYTGGKLITIDISEDHINLCKKHTAEFLDVIEYVCSDSVEYLKNMTNDEVSKLDLIYLDSMDLYIPDPEPSMKHHLNELLSVYDRLSDNCSIAIDDNYLPGTVIYWNWLNPDGTILRGENFETYGNIIGKGKLCNEFLLENNWKRFDNLFERYSNNVFYYERETPKLKLVHILNKTDGEREINSINSLSKLKDFGVDYIQQVTPLYEGEDYKNNRPITWRPDSPHNKGHYGNYLSFKQAIKDNFTDDIDALILCECDSILDIPYENFQSEMKKTLDFCKKHGIYQFSWGGRTIEGNIQVGEILKTDEEYPEYCVVGKIILAHFIMLTKESRDFYLRKIDTMAWDVADIWLNEIIFSGEHDGTFTGPGRQATVYKRLAYQYEGLSLLDGYVKGEKK